MINTWKYTETKVNGELFLANTKNRYEVVTQRPYHDKKGILPDGTVLTLRILEDVSDYGVDKNTGKARPTNRGQNFDVVILCGKTELPLGFGDVVALEDFDFENSFAMNFDLVMRFKGVKRLAHAGGGANAPQQHQ